MFAGTCRATKSRTCWSVACFKTQFTKSPALCHRGHIEGKSGTSHTSIAAPATCQSGSLEHQQLHRFFLAPIASCQQSCWLASNLIRHGSHPNLWLLPGPLTNSHYHVSKNRAMHAGSFSSTSFANSKRAHFGPQQLRREALAVPVIMPLQSCSRSHIAMHRAAAPSMAANARTTENVEFASN